MKDLSGKYRIQYEKKLVSGGLFKKVLKDRYYIVREYTYYHTCSYTLSVDGFDREEIVEVCDTEEEANTALAKWKINETSR